MTSERSAHTHITDFELNTCARSQQVLALKRRNHASQDVILFIELSHRRLFARDMVWTARLDDSMVYLCFNLFIFGNLYSFLLGGGGGFGAMEGVALNVAKQTD